MDYEEMCRYVAAREGFADWDLFIAATHKRAEALRLTRQICMYLGYELYKKLTLAELGRPFHKDHSTVIHSVRTIGFERSMNRSLDMKLTAYLKDLSEIIANDVPEVTPEAIEVINSLTPTIEKMRIIAEAYCDITGKKIV